MKNQIKVVEKLFQEHGINYIPAVRVMSISNNENGTILFLVSGGVLHLPHKSVKIE